MSKMWSQKLKSSWQVQHMQVFYQNYFKLLLKKERFGTLNKNKAFRKVCLGVKFLEDR